MNERDVTKQIENMVSFILQEAKEKAAETMLKAEEEFNIAKLQAVQAERQRIDTEFERKKKQVEIQKRIAHSNEVNASRLRILKAREEVTTSVYDDALKQLAEVSKGANYKELLADLMAQGFVSLSEEKVLIRCRKADEDLVKGSLPAAIKTYKDKTGCTVAATIDSANPLPPAPGGGNEGASCCGGVEILTTDGKIKCSNTLDQRLSICFTQQLPQVKKQLFGKSKTRQYEE